MTVLLTIVTIGTLAAATGLIADIIKGWRINPPKFNLRKHWRDYLMMGGLTIAALGVMIGLALEATNK